MIVLMSLTNLEYCLSLWMPEMCTYCVGSRNQGDKYGDDYQDEYSRSLKEWCVDTGASRHVCCIVVGSSHIR